MTILVLGQFFAVIILGSVAAIVFILALYLAEITNFLSKKSKFEWVYSKLLYSYKIKVLQDELKFRSVKMEDLYEIIDDALGKKSKKRHVLDQVEEEVKGEVEDVSPVKTSDKK